MVKKLEKGTTVVCTKSLQKNTKLSKKGKKFKVRKLMLILFALTMYLCASTKKYQREVIWGAMDARRRVKKLVHTLTWRTKTLRDQERWPSRKMKAKDKCIARISTTFFYNCLEKGHLFKVYPKGKNPKPNLSIHSNMLRRPKFDARKVMSSPHSRTNTIWVPKSSLLTLMDPSWDGYQNVLKKFCRYPKMIWSFGVLERFNSILISSYQSYIDYYFKIGPKMNLVVISLTSYSSLTRTCVVRE
jgi:hypothetical protein